MKIFDLVNSPRKPDTTAETIITVKNYLLTVRAISWFSAICYMIIYLFLSWFQIIDKGLQVRISIILTPISMIQNAESSKPTIRFLMLCAKCIIQNFLEPK